MRRADSLEKTLMLGKIEGGRRRGLTEGEMVGWHHWLNACEFEWTLGAGEGQGSLTCCSSWDLRDLGMTYLNNNYNVSLKIISPISLFLLMRQTFRELGGNAASLSQGRPETCGHPSASSACPGPRPGGITGPCACVPCGHHRTVTVGSSLRIWYLPNEVLPHFEPETKRLWLSFSCAALQE